MSWRIERRGPAAVVTMNTNRVNAQNRAFFADLHEAFDALERDHAESPVVLTGQDGRFSADLDLDEELPDGMTAEQSRHAHRRYWEQLKGSPAPW
jgi:enoyl-CoA hydratase